jgi:hypothetical protein
MKWNSKGKVEVPKTFSNTYKTDVQIIDNENFKYFLGYD